MLVAWLTVIYSESTERTWAAWKNYSQLRRSLPGLDVFLNVMFGERTGRAFWRSDVGTKPMLSVPCEHAQMQRRDHFSFRTILSSALSVCEVEAFWVITVQ
jgi:hypothetical protein